MKKVKEIFKDIPGYEGLYQASNKGRIKSLPRMRTWGNRTFKTLPRYLKPKIHNGYYQVALCKDQKLKSFAVHLLVIRAFLPQEEGRPFANHIDRNKLNNHIENLEWVNRRENSSHSAKLRGTKTGFRYVYNAPNKTNPFGARVKVDKKTVYLGCHATPELAYQTAIDYINSNNIENRYS